MVDEQNHLALLSDHINSNRAFHALRKRRSRFSWTLTGILLASYYAFIMIVAYKPELLAAPLYRGTVITVGIPLGLSVILLALVLTGIYVVRANNDFDPATRAIVEAAKRAACGPDHES
jgi:uncharacterized membrane protein (DUF485 family)